ncbi:MAG TPA: hypothetical protein VF276_09760 [Chloroflexia bacterium]
MDNETRHLDHEAARAAGLPADGPSAPGNPPAGNGGTPTTYLPPVTNAATASEAPRPSYAPPATGPTYTPPAPGAVPAYTPPRPAGNGQARRGSGPESLIPLALIAVGILALFGGFRWVFGAAIPLALGLIFLYVSSQGPGRLGFRIPGCILTGLGAGIVLDSMIGGGWSAVGLGLGFVALWVMDRAQLWWLIPGAAVGLGGLQSVWSGSDWGGNWFFPLALIAFGAYLLSGRQWRARR